MSAEVTIVVTVGAQSFEARRSLAADATAERIALAVEMEAHILAENIRRNARPATTDGARR